MHQGQGKNHFQIMVFSPGNGAAGVADIFPHPIILLMEYKFPANVGVAQEVFDFYFFQIIITHEYIKPERKIRTT